MLFAFLALSLSSTDVRDGSLGSSTAVPEKNILPNPSGIDVDPYNVFWFLHVTDTQECWLYEAAATDPGLAHQYFCS